MEPLLLASRPGVTEKLYGFASDLLAASGKAYPQLPPPILERLATLVQGMNCYYSNLIEAIEHCPSTLRKRYKRPKTKQNRKQATRKKNCAHWRKPTSAPPNGQKL